MNISKNIVIELQHHAVVKLHGSLADYTTFKTGGPADILVLPRSSDNVAAVIRLARSENIPLTVIGGGSNLLVGDKGIRGITLRICKDKQCPAIIGIRDGLVYCDAQVKKEDLTQFAIEHGLGDVAFMAGIPGCIGGGIVMNAGTTLGCFIDILKKIDYLDADGNSHTIDVNPEMSAYRTLRLPDGAVITGGYFRLPEANPAETMQDIEAIIAERNQKHPLQYPSAGSVFKNPVGQSSWKLVNDAGLKGKTIGGAQISELHTNFIVNTGNARSRDIKDLVELVQAEVQKQFAVSLETEIKMLGEF